MDLVWNPLAVPSIVGMLLAWAMAGFVYWTAPWNALNRHLALVLAIDGTTFGTATGLQFLMGDPHDAYGWRAVTIVFSLSLPWAYVLFLSALDSPLVRPLKATPARALLYAGLLGAPLLYFAFPTRFVAGMTDRNPYAEWTSIPGEWFPWLGNVGLATVGLGLLVALAAVVQSAPGSVARERAKAVAIAFGLRDGLYVVLMTLYRTRYGRGDATMDQALILLQAAIPILFVLALGYGVLRTQIFDLDLKVKLGVKRAIVLSFFIVVFFLGSEGTEALVENEWGNWGGFVTAGILAFALKPLEALAERLASAAFPGVDTTAGYAHLRKRAVYRAAVESTLEEKGIDAEERGILDRLRAKLDLDAAEARAIEQEARLHAQDRTRAAPT